MVNATHIRVLCQATSDTQSQTAQRVVETGAKYAQPRIVIDRLAPHTLYTVFLVACNDKGEYGALQHVQFATTGAPSDKYPWEESRSGITSFTDLVLCYGGSNHRKPYEWDKQRFAPYITYKDEQNTEHWLFDAFLCIEFQTSVHSYMLGLKLPSAGKEQWQELIDYWFDRDKGMNALEAAVRDASKRLGAPSSKRKVIMVLPDAIIYQTYDDTKASTTYWGALEGRTMDFSVAEDRVAASRWYIDEIRRKFFEANYQYIELAGFYIVSEDLATPKFGWNPELKKSDEIVPPVSKYLHGLNECLCWIPYNCATGYNHWKEMGIDYAYMQPNYFWDGTKSFSQFFSDIKSNDLSMELEFETDPSPWAGSVLEGDPDCDTYKARFREYMSNAKANGVYGTKPLSYYHGTNGLYDLWKSADPKDKALYHEFCRFVINNPLRN